MPAPDVVFALRPGCDRPDISRRVSGFCAIFVSAVGDVASLGPHWLAYRAAAKRLSEQFCEAIRLVTASTWFRGSSIFRRVPIEPAILELALSALVFKVCNEALSNIKGIAPWVTTGNSIALIPGNILSELCHECA